MLNIHKCKKKYTDTYIEKKRWKVIELIVVISITVISLISVKCFEQNNLNIIENVLYSVIAAGIFYLITICIPRFFCSYKMRSVVDDLNMQCCSAIYEMFYIITKDENWDKKKYDAFCSQLLKMNKETDYWHDEVEPFGSRIDRITGDNVIGEPLYEIIANDIQYFELLLPEIERSFEYFSIKDITYIQNFKRSVFFKRIRICERAAKGTPPPKDKSRTNYLNYIMIDELPFLLTEELFNESKDYVMRYADLMK